MGIVTAMYGFRDLEDGARRYALSEEIVSDNGTPVNANLWEYLLPTAPHVPELTVELV